MPQDGGADVALPPHSLALLLADYHLGPFHLRYSTSRPLTQAQVNGTEVAVFYGVSGTPGETALAFAQCPAVLQVDAQDEGDHGEHDRAGNGPRDRVLRRPDDG